MLEAKRRELKGIFKYEAAKDVNRNECYNSKPIKPRLGNYMEDHKW